MTWDEAFRACTKLRVTMVRCYVEQYKGHNAKASHTQHAYHTHIPTLAIGSWKRTSERAKSHEQRPQETWQNHLKVFWILENSWYLNLAASGQFNKNQVSQVIQQFTRHCDLKDGITNDFNCERYQKENKIGSSHVPYDCVAWTVFINLGYT